MILAAIAMVIAGGIAFVSIVDTLAFVADTPVLAKRPLSKFLVAFFFIWGAQALLIGSASVLWVGLQIFAGNENAATVTTGQINVGLAAWIGGMVSSGLATLFLPARFGNDAPSFGSTS